MKPRIPRRLEFLVLLGALFSIAIAYLPHCPPAEPPIGPPESDVSEWALLRAEVKKRLAADVAAGQRTMLESAALYDALDRLPAAPLPLTSKEADLPAPDRAYGQVIQWVEAHFDGSDGWATVARLQSELCQAFEQPGGIRLPDPSSVESIEHLLADARSRLPIILKGKTTKSRTDP
jgi:hypothetical protein